jgi:hypothetical protein
MNLNSLTKFRRFLSPQLFIASSVVLVLLITTGVFYFICYSKIFYAEQVGPIYTIKLLFTARLYRADIIL